MSDELGTGGVLDNRDISDIETRVIRRRFMCALDLVFCMF